MVWECRKVKIRACTMYVHVPEPEQTICILKQNDKNHSMESDLISVIAGYKSYFIGELKIKL